MSRRSHTIRSKLRYLTSLVPMSYYRATVQHVDEEFSFANMEA